MIVFRASVPRSYLSLISTFAFVCLIASCSVQSKADPSSQQGPQVAEKETKSQEIPAAVVHEILVQKGDNLRALARKFLPRSSLMTVSELEMAIRAENGLTKQQEPQPGQQLRIPTLEPQPLVEKSRNHPKDFDARAIYLTANTAGSVYGMELVRRWKSAGGNAVVFDIKDSDGGISVDFKHPLAPKRRPLISNLPKYVRFLHSLDMHVIARIALFRDDHIAQRQGRLAIHSRATGEPWQENGKLVWADPSNPEVQAYNLELAKFVAGSGVDEVQFDYVRFPAEGNQKDAQFTFEKLNETKSTPKLTRSDVINSFLKQAYAELRPKGVLLSLDVFGVMAWQRGVDLAHTGQDVAAMARYCDVLSPMIYPSHFYGMDGYALPGDAPQHFITTSMERFRKITSDSGVVIRPWLQAFAWKTKTYSPQYIQVQVAAAKQQGGIGFLLWNARNDYVRPLAAMPAMVADPQRYFGKAVASQVAATPAKAGRSAVPPAVVLPPARTTHP